MEKETKVKSFTQQAARRAIRKGLFTEIWLDWNYENFYQSLSSIIQ